MKCKVKFLTLNNPATFVVLNIKLTAGVQPESFQGTGGSVELGQFSKHFVKNARKKNLAG